MSAACPLCDVATVFSVIYDVSHQNADQLDLHQMIFAQQSGGDGSNEMDVGAMMLRRAQENELKKRAALVVSEGCNVWSQARDVALTVLRKHWLPAQQQQQQPCSGPLDLRCDHVAAVAACFAACKFIGTPHVAFVTLDGIAVQMKESFPSASVPHARSAATGGGENSGGGTKQADAATFKNMLAGSSDDDDDDDDDSNERNSEFDGVDDFSTSSLSSQQSRFVARVVETEALLMKRCVYFSAL